jgi:hemin uptake protein HemP
MPHRQTGNPENPIRPVAAQRPTHCLRYIDSEALLGADRAIVIMHAGREYRLCMTRNGKLILTA